MHIPDGFLATPVWAGLQAVSLPAIAWTARKAQVETEESRAPLLGVLGAFVFAAQMINFPVGVGASGHLVGSALLAYTVGPWAASMVMAAILIIQALVFQDGGLLAFGANTFNMAVLGVWAAYLPYRLWGGGRARRAAILLGGFCSVFAASLAAIGELLLSEVRIPSEAMHIALFVFGVTAVIEGAITLAVLEAVGRINPRWVKAPEPMGRPAFVLLIALAAVAAFAGFWIASTRPDGLEQLLQNAGIQNLERKYLAAPTGIAVVLVLCLFLWRWMSRPRSA